MYRRALFKFFANFPERQHNWHIAGAFKKSHALFPANAASAILDPNKLLLHPSCTGWAYFVAVPFLFYSLLFRQLFFRYAMFFDAGFIPWKFFQIGMVYLVIGNPDGKGFYFFIYPIHDISGCFPLWNFPMLFIITTSFPKHPVCYLHFLLLLQVFISFVWLL